MKRQEWIYRLPKDADKSHDIVKPEPVTRLSIQVKKEKDVEEKQQTSSGSPVWKSYQGKGSEKATSSQVSSKGFSLSQRSDNSSPIKCERPSQPLGSKKSKMSKKLSGQAKGKGSLDMWLSSKPLMKDILAVSLLVVRIIVLMLKAIRMIRDSRFLLLDVCEECFNVLLLEDGETILDAFDAMLPIDYSYFGLLL